MKILILSWEYPPRVIGKISQDVSSLASFIADSGSYVGVVTFREAQVPIHRERDRLVVYSAPNPVGPHVNILTWSLTLSSEFQRLIADILYTSGPVDLIDAHEWQVVSAAVAAKKAFDIPLVYTVYSLEDQRSPGPSSPLSVGIKSIEWLGAYEANLVVARSTTVLSEMLRIHKVPREKMRLVDSSTPNWASETMTIYQEVAKGV